MRANPWLTLGLTLLLCPPTQAFDLVWEFPRTAEPTGFVVTVQREGDAAPTTYPVPASPPGAFRPTRGTAAGDSFCARLGPLLPGRHEISVQARLGDTLSARSDTIPCTVPPETGECTDAPMVQGTCQMPAPTQVAAGPPSTERPPAPPPPAQQEPEPELPPRPETLKPTEPPKPPPAVNTSPLPVPLPADPPLVAPTRPTRPAPRPAPTPAPPPSRGETPAPPPSTKPPGSPGAPGATAAANVMPPLTMGLPWDAGGCAGTSATAAPDPAVTHAGSPAIVLTGEGDYYGQTTSPRFAVEDTRTYQVSAWVKTDAITEFVEVDVFWYDAAGEEYAAWGEAIGGQVEGTQDWTHLQGTVTPPPGAVRAVVQVRAKSSGGKAWVSEVQMVPFGHPPAAQPVAPAQPSPASPPETTPTLAQLQARFTELEQQYRQQQAQVAAEYHAGP